MIATIHINMELKSTINSKLKDNKTIIKQRLIDNIKEFIYRTKNCECFFAGEQDANFNPGSVIEHSFISIMISSDKISKNMFDLFCDILTLCYINNLYPNYQSIQLFRNNKTYNNSIKKLSMLSVAAIIKCAPNEASCYQNLLLEILLDFAVYVGDPSSIGVTNIIETIVYGENNKAAYVNVQKNNNSASASCISDSINTDSAKELIIKEQGYTVLKDKTYISVGVVIHNPNKDRVAKQNKIRLLLLDSNNNIIEEYNYNIGKIGPNMTVKFGKSLYLNYENISKCRINASCDFFDTFLEQPDFSLRYKKVSETSNQFNKQIIFNLENEGDNVIVSRESNIIFRDENNKIVGGASCYNNRIEPHSTAVVTFNVPTELKYTKIEGVCLL